MFLKQAILHAKKKYSFSVEAIVLLHDHLHTIFSFSDEFLDYSEVWRLIKYKYSILSKQKNVWQRSFWEHVIRDEEDLHNHLNYIHFNPVKHDYVERAYDYPYSSFRRYLKKGYYDINWGSSPSKNLLMLDFE